MGTHPDAGIVVVRVGPFPLRDSRPGKKISAPGGIAVGGNDILSTVALLVFGVWLVLADAEWSLTQLWILLAFAAFALTFMIGAIYLSRITIGLEQLTTQYERSPYFLPSSIHILTPSVLTCTQPPFGRTTQGPG